MQLHYLQYFISAVECKSLNRAARSLDMLPQTLSLGVVALERELGYPLLERSSNGVIPTHNGEIVYHEALNIVSAIAGWKSLSAGADEDATVRLGASTSLMFALVPQVIIDIKSRHPNIYFDLRESFVEEIFRDIVDKRMIGIITCATDMESHYCNLIVQNELNVEVGPEDGWLVAINRKHPYAQLPRLRTEHLKDLRLAWNPHRDQTFVYREICKNFRETIHMPEMGNLLRLIGMDPSIAAILPRSVLGSPGGLGENIRGIEVENFPMTGRIWLISPKKLSHEDRIVLDGLRKGLSTLEIASYGNKG